MRAIAAVRDGGKRNWPRKRPVQRSLRTGRSAASGAALKFPNAAGSLAFARRDAQHDVEPRREFADFRIGKRREIDRHRVACLGVADAAEDAVALVLRMALDVALRGEVVLRRAA